MRSEPAGYVGRFAPSPTGPLHFGSLLAAVASYVQARRADGQWILRIEDIDPPREQPGSDTRIVDTLRAYGFEWDGPVLYQSEAEARHRSVIAELLASQAAYHCSCSRRDLADIARGPLGIIYPGTCRNGSRSTETAIRIRTHDRPIEFVDQVQGIQLQRLESESGDFIIRRRDGLVAYHLAVVVDDFDQGITEIVRGIDLMDSTQRQIHLQQSLGMTTPSYLHIPVVVNVHGQKLSKLTGATPIGCDNSGDVLVNALRALQQRPPDTLVTQPLPAIWEWAFDNWDKNQLMNVKEVPAASFGFG